MHTPTKYSSRTYLIDVRRGPRQTFTFKPRAHSLVAARGIRPRSDISREWLPRRLIRFLFLYIQMMIEGGGARDRGDCSVEV